MGWFNNDNDGRKRYIEYELRDLQSEYDSLNREIYYASEKWFSYINCKDKEKELDYWKSLETQLINKQYDCRRKIKDLEYELRSL